MAQLQYLHQQQQQLELQQRALAAGWGCFAMLPGLGQAPLAGLPIPGHPQAQLPSLAVAGQAAAATAAAMPWYGDVAAAGQFASCWQAAGARQRALPAAPAAPARACAADRQRAASTCSRQGQASARQAGGGVRQQHHLQQQRQEEEAEARQWKQQQTCTCGECIGGWVSPRLLSELAAAAELER